MTTKIVLLPCPFCGEEADLFTEFDIPRAGCSDEDCPAAFGDYGVDVEWWNRRLGDRCPQCKSGTGLKQPRGLEPYCEDCGYPDEDFDN